MCVCVCMCAWFQIWALLLLEGHLEDKCSPVLYWAPSAELTGGVDPVTATCGFLGSRCPLCVWCLNCDPQPLVGSCATADDILFEFFLARFLEKIKPFVTFFCLIYVYTFQQLPSSGLVLELFPSTAPAFSFFSEWSAPFVVSSVGRWGHERCRRHWTRKGGARRGSSTCADGLRGRKGREAARWQPTGNLHVQPRSRSWPPLISEDLKGPPGEQKVEWPWHTGVMSHLFPLYLGSQTAYLKRLLRIIHFTQLYNWI